MSSRDRKRKAEEEAGEADDHVDDASDNEEQDDAEEGEGEEGGDQESSGESVDEAELWRKYGPGLVQTRTKRTTAGKR
jgi:hypothetical protein